MSKIYFNGPVGQIEGRYHDSKNPTAPVALVLHPDPIQGGTMNNKVVYTVFHAFVETGFSVLRINFPGVGKSEGIPGNGEDEFKAASVALDWLQHSHPEASHYWVGGVSFGSLMDIKLMIRRPEIEDSIMIAPPVAKYNFSFPVPCPLKGLIITGENDKISPPDRVSKLITEWSKNKNDMIVNHIIKDADHFFVDHLEMISQMCIDYINTSLAMRVTKPVRKKRRRRRKRDKEDDYY
jgi:alpha/beta superfamily hydrolase